MRVTITYCRYYMQRELRREKRFRYRGVTITAAAVAIPLDHVLVSQSNGYGLMTNCSGHDSSKRRIATTQNFCPTIAVSAVTITVSVVTIQVYFSPCMTTRTITMHLYKSWNWRQIHRISIPCSRDNWIFFFKSTLKGQNYSSKYAWWIELLFWISRNCRTDTRSPESPYLKIELLTNIKK